MISPNVTRKEFFDYLIAHSNEINKLAVNLEMQWNQAIRNSKKGEPFTLAKDFVFDDNRYMVMRYCPNGFHRTISYSETRLIFVEVAKGKHQIYHWRNDGNLMVYSAHFFERYQLRCKVKGSLDKVIKQWFKRSTAMMYVYKDLETGHYALAMDDGLVLGLYDKRKDYVMACTFVDYGLLKASQVAAFKRVIPVLRPAIQKAQNLHAQGLSVADVEENLTNAYQELSGIVKEIYGLHFQSKNPI